MKRNARRHGALAGQRGAISVLIAISMVALLAFVAVGVDIGYLVYSQKRLQAATDAAALAGAMDLWNDSWQTASGDAQAYAAGQSATTSNALPGNVTVTSTTISGLKLSSVALPYAQAVSGYNGIQVTQQATVPTFFARVFGVKSLTISATSKAGAGGGAQAAQYNVVIILDTTHSMNDTDSNCTNSQGTALSRIACAKAGALKLLTGLTNAGDNVGLMTFPPISPSSSSYSFSCSSTEPGVVSTANNGYSAVAPGAASSAAVPTYQLSPLGSGFLSSNGDANTSSGLVQALGGGSCGGLAAPGGLGTFYAQAIAAAQATLPANPTGQNAIILLSDGDATSTTTQLGTTYGSATLNGKANPNYVYGSECQAAIDAATTAKAAGTLIYTVAYIGGETSSATCSDGSDSLTPCNTMEAIATSSAYFYSDTCTNATGGTAGLSSIFGQIAYSLTKSRLLPPSAT